MQFLQKVGNGAKRKIGRVWASARWNDSAQTIGPEFHNRLAKSKNAGRQADHKRGDKRSGLGGNTCDVEVLCKNSQICNQQDGISESQKARAFKSTMFHCSSANREKQKNGINTL